MQNKKFDDVTARALEIIAKDGLVDHFLKACGLTVCEDAFFPVSEVRRRFDRYTQKTMGLLYTREFFEMILLTSLPDLSVTDIEMGDEEVDCFYGLAYTARLVIDTDDAGTDDSRHNTGAFSDDELDVAA